MPNDISLIIEDGAAVTLTAQNVSPVINTETTDVTLNSQNTNVALDLVTNQPVVLNITGGENGQDGVGLPIGGTTGQVPVKQSNADYDIAWEDQSGGGSIDGSGAAGQVTYWIDADTVSGSDNLYFDSSNIRLSIGSGTAPSGKIDIKASQDRATLGSEMISATADRDFSSDTGNWTGSGWSIGSGVASHAVAGTSTFTLSAGAISSAPVVGGFYLLVFTCNTTTVAAFGQSNTLVFGNSGGVFGNEIGPITHTFVANAATTGTLIIQTGNTWVGTIDNVSIKPITPQTPLRATRRTSGVVVLEERTPLSPSGLTNMGLGLNSLAALYGAGPNGNKNTAFGVNALRSVTTGNLNCALGDQALVALTTGSNNMAFGTNALFSMSTNSANNVGIGTNAGSGVTRGSDNVCIGSTALTLAGIASNNTIIGSGSASLLTGGSNNIAIGYDVEFPVNPGSNQMTIGNILFGTGIDGTGTTVSTGKLGVKNNAPSYDLDINGQTRATQYLSNTATSATASAGLGAGTGASVTITASSPNWVVFSVTIGASPTINGDLVTVTMPSAFPTFPYPVCNSTSTAATTDWNKFKFTPINTTDWKITMVGTATAGATYSFIAHVMG